MLKLKDVKYSEAEITKEIRSYLFTKGIQHWKQFQSLGSPKGISDIIGCVKCQICQPCSCPKPFGRFLAIEVKTDSGKPTENQELFIERFRRAGGICFVARSADDVEKELDKSLSKEYEK